MGSHAPSRHQCAEYTPRKLPCGHSRAAGIPGPLRSVLDVSHVLDGLLRRTPCGSISPHSRVRASPFRDFPSLTAARARRSPLPSCRYVRPLALGLIIAAGNVRPTSGLSSVRESVADRRGLAHVLPASLLGFSFFGFSFASRGNACASPPSTAFHGPRRITDPQPGVLLRPRLPRPRFLASPF